MRIEDLWLKNPNKTKAKPPLLYCKMIFNLGIFKITVEVHFIELYHKSLAD